jgi:hypothetical protein
MNPRLANETNKRNQEVDGDSNRGGIIHKAGGGFRRKF